MQYNEADFAREVTAKGLSGLSEAGKTYYRQTLEADFAQARADHESRIAQRVEREADIIIDVDEDDALMNEMALATASAGSDAPSPLSYAEREHQRAIAAQWDDAGY